MFHGDKYMEKEVINMKDISRTKYGRAHEREGLIILCHYLNKVRKTFERATFEAQLTGANPTCRIPQWNLLLAMYPVAARYLRMRKRI